MTNFKVRPEVREGSIVVFDLEYDDPEMLDKLQRWVRQYGVDARFTVAERTERHVVLCDIDGRVLSFEGADEVRRDKLNIVFVKLADEAQVRAGAA